MNRECFWSLLYNSGLYICNPSTGLIDLEAKFEPSLLNTAIYLLGLSQQVSTFTINFQVCCFIFLVCY